MQPNLTGHPCFQPWTDPDSGVVSHLLVEHVAPVQQSLYFGTPSVSADGRWLWFMCAHPPGLVRTVGVVSLDPQAPLIRHFPHVQYRGHFEHAACVAPTDEPPGLYVCQGAEVLKLHVDGRLTPVATLPVDAHDFTLHPFRPSCMLDMSADCTRLLLAGLIKGWHFVAVIDRTTGETTLRKDLPTDATYSYFSPTDPTLFFVTVPRRHPQARVWLMDTHGHRDEPVLAQDAGHGLSRVNHEFWSPDGWLCWVDFDRGAYSWNPSSGQREHLWRRPMVHAHTTGDRARWCADVHTYHWRERDVSIRFYDRAADRETAIVTAMPTPGFNYHQLHCHPHPRFVCDDRWIVYTTTCDTGATVALCPAPTSAPITSQAR